LSRAPFSTSSVLVCSDDRCIHHRSILVHIELQGFENSRPNPLLRPLVETIIDSLPIAKTLGHVAPRCSCLRYPNDSIYESTITTFRRSPSTSNDQRLEFFPFLF
jgi:hypothetical protein